MEKSFSKSGYTTNTVLAGLGFGLGGSIVLFIIFCFIRPHHTALYAPRVKVTSLDLETGEENPSKLETIPKSLQNVGYFKWIPKIYAMTQDEIISKSGLDVAVCLEFLKMCIRVFSAITFISCMILIPVNYCFNDTSSVETLKKNDVFILLTPIFLTNKNMICHIVLTWVFNIIVCFFLWITFNKIIKIKRKMYMSKLYQNSRFMRTLMMTEIDPIYCNSTHALQSFLDSLPVNKPIERITMGRDTSSLNKLIKEHRKTVLKLESFAAKYKNHSSRPTMNRYKDEYKSGFNLKVDAYDYLFSKIRVYESQIDQARMAAHRYPPEPWGFVSYLTPLDAHKVAYEVKRLAQSTLSANKASMGNITIGLASRPEDLIWDNLILTRKKRVKKQRIGHLIFLLVTLLWIIPNAFISAFLSQISRIGAFSAGFKNFIDKNPGIFSMMQGIIAPLITIFLFHLLSIFMRKLSQWQGEVTKSDREKNTTSKLYVFFVFNNLIVFSVFGIIWGYIANVINTIKDENVELEGNLDAKFSTSVINASSFWITYILNASLGLTLEFLQIWPMIVRGFKKHFLNYTPRQQLKWSAPQHFNYAMHYNWMLFYSTIGFTFAIVQPLVLLSLLAYFSNYFYKKYSLNYIYITKAETDGLFWPFLFDNMIWGMVTGDVIAALLIWSHSNYIYACSMIPLLFMLLIFKFMSVRRHNDRFYFFIPTEKEMNQMIESGSPYTSQTYGYDNLENIKNEYQNPAIESPLLVPIVSSRVQNIIPCEFETTIYRDSDFFNDEINATGIAGLRSEEDDETSDSIRLLDFGEMPQQRNFSVNHSNNTLQTRQNGFNDKSSSVYTTVSFQPNTDRTIHHPFERSYVNVVKKHRVKRKPVSPEPQMRELSSAITPPKSAVTIPSKVINTEPFVVDYEKDINSIPNYIRNYRSYTSLPGASEEEFDDRSSRYSEITDDNTTIRSSRTQINRLFQANDEEEREQFLQSYTGNPYRERYETIDEED